jgi:ATP-dependent helicase/nuclease subunit B
LLGLIARARGFPAIDGEPKLFEYWSLARRLLAKNPIRPNKDQPAEEFLNRAEEHFLKAAGEYLTGNKEFTAKLHPAYAPYGDYDQLMRLEEWYGRR